MKEKFKKIMSPENTKTHIVLFVIVFAVFFLLEARSAPYEQTNYQRMAPIDCAMNTAGEGGRGSGEHGIKVRINPVGE